MADSMAGARKVQGILEIHFFFIRKYGVLKKKWQHGKKVQKPTQNWFLLAKSGII